MTNFISEANIDAVIESMDENFELYEHAIDSLSKEQPAIFAYLFSESFRLLNQKEREYLLYMTLVAWQSIRKAGLAPKLISQEQIEEAEEKNYALIQKSNSRIFRERLDLLFENYPQEDLLAFVEDALYDEEEELIGKAFREPIFLSLKSIIDCLCETG